MHVKDGNTYVLIGSVGGAPKHPVWVHNLRANPAVEIRDHQATTTRRIPVFVAEPKSSRSPS
jgi:hypothetical protein